MKIGILETGRTPDELIQQHGSYVDMIVALLNQSDPPQQPVEYQAYCVMQGEFPTSATECDAWLITGSKHGVYENLPWMLRVQACVREIRDHKKPLVGICFGHQIIAQALGGQVAKVPQGWGVGLHQYQLSHQDFNHTTGVLTLHAMHQDQIVHKPENAKVIAYSDFCPYAGLLYDDPILTLQGHPEFSRDYEAALITLRRGAIIPDATAQAGLNSLETGKTDARLVANWINRVLQSYPT